MKAHIGVDAGTRYVHSLAVTAANATDLSQLPGLVRDDDEVVYADAGYQGAHALPGKDGLERVDGVEFRVATRKSVLRTLPEHDRQVASRQAGAGPRLSCPKPRKPFSTKQIHLPHRPTRATRALPHPIPPNTP